MKTFFRFSLLLLCLTLAFLLTGKTFTKAQTEMTDNAAKKPTKALWELAAAKREEKPFVILTPTDLAELTASEQNFLAAFGDPCDTASQISFGQTVNGTLGSTDCRLEDGSYADFYVFNGAQGQIVDLRMNSTAFDTYLGLADETGSFVREDDDSGGGTNSRIVATLPETGLYVVLANSVFPNQLGAYSLSLQEIINCTYSISPTYTDIPATGGTFSLTITTQNGCQWRARTNNESFITVNTPTGTGTGSISYTVAPNGSGLARGGGLIINDSLTTSMQQPSLPCNFVLTPNTANFPIEGGSGSITVTVQEGCTWRVFSNYAFITASGTGSGNGTINYTVVANPGADRSGSIRIGDSAPVYFYINQTGFNCVTKVTPSEVYAGKTGKTGTVSVTSNCSWTVTPNDPFIEVTNASGTGSGTFNYRVLANNAGDDRSNVMRVNDGQNSYTIWVNQIGRIYTAKFDFTRDGKADPAVYRPAEGAWWTRLDTMVFRRIQFGAPTDKIVPADFDGNGITDTAVWRPATGDWFFENVSGLSAVQFGAEGDIPVPADYDGDGFADIAVYRPSNGVWYIRKSSAEELIVRQFGAAEDIPTIGDFDGDGKSDIAVWRPSTGTWFRLSSANDSFFAVQFGASEDKPVPADFDGDGKTDISVWRPSDGNWYRINSANGSFSAVQFGAPDDLPVAADYDGDGKTDVAVFRPADGNWYLSNSSTGFTAIYFGVPGDKPIPNAFIR